VELDGENYLFVKKSGLIFAFVTKFNVSPSLFLELLERLTKVFKDYCGVLTEEGIRKNFILIYELLDEVLDYGYPQGSSTELLRNYVHNEPIIVESARMKLPHMNPKTTPSNAVHKPITTVTGGRAGSKQRNEIFVDIIERLNVLFSPNGYVLNSNIDGCIQMKSYLSGQPELRLALNEDLVVGSGGGGNYGAVVLDDCNFHECCNLEEFEHSRILSFHPPDGEFSVLNYRITAEFRAPFRVFPTIEEKSSTRIELGLLVRADIPDKKYGSNVTITIPLPRTTATASAELMGGVPGQTTEYIASERRMEWTIKKFMGGTELSVLVKINLDSPATQNTRREIGPIALGFEVPMYNVSNLLVRYLRISDQGRSYNPYRWVRYVTQSSSYVCRL